MTTIRDYRDNVARALGFDVLPYPATPSYQKPTKDGVVVLWPDEIKCPVCSGKHTLWALGGKALPCPFCRSMDFHEMADEICEAKKQEAIDGLLQRSRLEDQGSGLP